VTKIGEFAFSWCKALKDITFDENIQLKEIEDLCFSYCDAMRDITIPASVEVIADNAFYHGLYSNIRFAEGSKLTTIGNEAFCSPGPGYMVDGKYVYSTIEDIEIPAGVASIGYYAFLHYQYLKTVSFLGPKPTTLGTGNCFIGCGQLTNIYCTPENYDSWAGTVFNTGSASSPREIAVTVMP
jgi:hypothetical protein